MSSPPSSLPPRRDRRKLTFYFIAERRIDFRELVRELFRCASLASSSDAPDARRSGTDHLAPLRAASLRPQDAHLDGLPRRHLVHRRLGAAAAAIARCVPLASRLGLPPPPKPPPLLLLASNDAVHDRPPRLPVHPVRHRPGPPLPRIKITSPLRSRAVRSRRPPPNPNTLCPTGLPSPAHPPPPPLLPSFSNPLCPARVPHWKGDTLRTHTYMPLPFCAPPSSSRVQHPSFLLAFALLAHHWPTSPIP